MRKNATLVRLGQRIQALRKQREVSQEELAHQAGLHRTYMGMVERGERNITILNLLRIVGVLGVDPGELLANLPRVPPKETDSK